MFGTGRRSSVEIDVEKVLDVTTLLSSGAGAAGPTSSSNRGCDRVFGRVLTLLLDGGALDSLSAEAALANKRLRWFVVNRSQGRKLGEETLEENGRETGNCGGDGWFLSEDDIL